MTPTEIEVKHKAGIIPYYKDEIGDIKMMFMKPSNAKFGGSQFQIAKGNIDPGEVPSQAALREGEEELGLQESNIYTMKKLTSQRITGMDETYLLSVFAVLVHDPEAFGKPHYETGSTTWMSVDEFRAVGRLNQLSIVQLMEQV